MKKIRNASVLSVCIALAMLYCTNASAQLQEHRYAIISTTDAATPIPLYKAPGGNADVSYSYYHGTLAKLIAQYDDAWWEVAIGGVHGYMSSAYLQIMDFAEMTTQLPVMNIKNKTDTGCLNLREKPSLESDIIRQYYNDEQVLLMGISDEWYHVIGYGGRVGYMKPEFLEASGTTGEYMFTEDLLQLRPRSK